MPTQTVNAGPPSEFAKGVRTVLSHLFEDMTISAVDVESLAWDRPIFILRSAHWDRLRAFLSVVLAHRPSPPLHIMSHAQDEAALSALVGGDFTFYPYPMPGRYRLEHIPPAT